MQMSEEEIVIDYKQAKNKKAQVEILADLNACSKEQIIEILKRNGISSKELPRERKKAVAEPEQKEVKQEAVKEKEDKPMVNTEESPFDPLQFILDSIVSESIILQGEILKKEKALEKLTVAIGAIKEAHEILEGEKKQDEEVI